MQKTVLTILLIALIITFSSSSVFARSSRSDTPENLLNFTFFINPYGIGYMHHVDKNFYATGNMDYSSTDSDLKFQVGAAYLIPQKIFIFRFFGGAGFQFSRNDGYQYPYLSVGSKFLFLLWEIIHPLKSHEDPQYRFGFSFSF